MTSSSSQTASQAPSRPRRGRPSGQGRGEQLREALVAAALALFAQRGISETPLSAVAARAGVTKAMVHYHFKSREQLIDVLIQEHLIPLRTRAISALNDSPDPAVALTAFATCLIDQAVENAWLAPLWIREFTSGGMGLRERMAAHIDAGTERTVLNRIEQWQAAGNLNPGVRPDLLAMSILGMAMVPLAAAARSRSGMKAMRDSLVGHVQALVLGGAIRTS